MGRCRRPVAGVAWLNSWTPVFSEDILVHLTSQGARGLRPIPALLRCPKSVRSAVVELEIEPSAHAAVAQRIACDTCGRPVPVPMPEPLRIVATGAFTSADIIRVVEYPTAILVNASFREAIERSGSENVLFRSVELVDLP